ncbi:WXG100 family type VII secretion target [Nocardioides zhouii]|uniref:WXG100 family type VII secretion target n=1 Tax=Nocardioides zhouii TaxID=1168729 RepID=A0A4Q2T298_9ACTN|nr:hypothetical protein [Nocardioides zhouii]RYC11054.1 hypothetical protein EUA94_10565 [Nocardioides zhouii]
MNGMIGADPDALDRLAGDFDRGASSLEATVLRIRVAVVANPWAGPRATRFRNDWDHRHGPQLKRTAGFLRGAAKELRIQAQQQRQASSAGGGSIAGQSTGGGGGYSRDRAVPTSPLEFWDNFQTKFQQEFGVLGILGATGALGRNASLVGRYPKGWEDLLRKSRDLRLPKNVPLPKELGPRASDFLKYKRSFNGIFSVNGLGQKVDNIPGLGKLDKFLGRAGLASAAAELATNPTPLGVSKTVAAALKTSKNPVGYLGGMALSSLNMAADAGKDVDWSPEAFHNTVDFVRSNGGAGMVAEEFGKAAHEVFTEKIWSIF